jgi:tetratricopeptide (TPR) repeat protein
VILDADDYSSDRMYQRKIAQWELEKKHKGPEMRAIIRLARQRQAAGQESIFRIRGRKTDIEEVFRYFKRRGEDPNTLDVRDSPIPPTISVETPLPPAEPFDTIDEDETFDEYSFSIPPGRLAISYPSPETDYPPTSNAGSAGSAGSSSGSSIRSDSVVSTPLIFTDGPLACQMIPNYPIIGMPIDSTFELQCSRYLLDLTQLFFDQVVPLEFYKQDGANGVKPGGWRRTLSSWSRATSEGNELMQRGQAGDTLGQLLNKAHGSVKKHITSRSPIILLRYFEIIYTLRSFGDAPHELFLAQTLKYVHEMAQTVLPSWHPIRRLTALLLHKDVNPLIAPLVQRGIIKSLEILWEKCGAQHPRILYVLDSRTQTLLDEHQYEAAIRSANLYSERAELIRNDRSYESCQALRMLGDAYVAQHKLPEAKEAYNKAFDFGRRLPSLKDRGIIGVKTKRGLSSVAKAEGQIEEAQRHLQVALQMARVAFGEDDVQVKLVQKDLDALGETVTHANGFAYRPLDV